MECSEMKLVIVIPVSNHWDLTWDCLRYLFERTDYKPHRIIVVDDGSTDETADRLLFIERGRGGQVRVLHHPMQWGFAHSCNDGMALAQREGATHILLLNNDVEVWSADWLDQIVQTLGQGQVVVGKDYVDFNSATNVDDVMVPYIGGWCMAFSVELLREIGPLDVTFSPAFYEDVEFCARAQAAGYQLVGLGEGLGIHHLYGKTSLDGRLNVDEIHIQNQPRFREKIRALRRRPCSNAEVKGTSWAFYCPGNMVFDDSFLEGDGLGGAESALVQLTRTLAAMGADVHVFNDCPSPGRFNGVHYHHIAQEQELLGREWDAFVLFRVSPNAALWAEVRAKKTLFWTCDQYTTMDWPESIFPFVDLTVAISEHHRQFLISHWRADRDKTIVLPLGVTPAEFSELPAKVRDRMIYCSVPRRGLKWLADIFPRVKARVPGATLAITGDYTLWGSPTPQNEEFKALFAGMEGVEFLGKVSRARLIEEMGKAELHVYPCDYEVQVPYTDIKVAGENFCLASLECQAAGTPTVATPNGALVTTVDNGNSGYLIRGHYPGEEAFTERVVNVVEDLLSLHRATLGQMARYARQRALTEFAWPVIARRWMGIVGGKK